MRSPFSSCSCFFYLLKHECNLTTNKCEISPSTIRSRDLFSQPLKHESPLITARPGADHINKFLSILGMLR